MPFIFLICLILHQFSPQNLLIKNQMTVKYYRNFGLQFTTPMGCANGMQLTIPMGCVSKFCSYVTMIPNFFTVIINEFFTNLTTFTWLALLFFFTHDQILVKMFIHYFFTILTLCKKRFNKFISIIFTSKNNNQLTKSIINTNKLVTKTTRNVIVIFFSKKVHSFQRFLNYTLNQHKL